MDVRVTFMAAGSLHLEENKISWLFHDYCMTVAWPIQDQNFTGESIDEQQQNECDSIKQYFVLEKKLADCSKIHDFCMTSFLFTKFWLSQGLEDEKEISRLFRVPMVTPWWVLCVTIYQKIWLIQKRYELQHAKRFMP